MRSHDLLDALAAEGGLARVDHLAALTNLSPRAVRAVAQRAGFWRPYPAVVGLPGIGLGNGGGRGRAPHAWAKAAVLHASGTTGRPERDLSALTRRTALHHLGVARSGPTRVEVVIPASRYLTTQPRLATVRSVHVLPGEVTEFEGVPVLQGAALIRDLAAVRDIARLRADAIALQHAGHLDIGDLRVMCERCSFFPGRAGVRRVLADLEAAGRVDSPLEHEFRTRFSQAGIVFDRGQVAVPAPVGAEAGPGPAPPSAPLHLDLGIAAIRFGIEVDSMAHHSGPEDLERDAERRNHIAEVADDWRILHATFADLGGIRWRRLVGRVRTVIGAQSRRYLGVPWPRPIDLRR